MFPGNRMFVLYEEKQEENGCSIMTELSRLSRSFYEIIA